MIRAYITKKGKIIVAIIVAAIVVPTGVCAISPLFRNATIDEPLPTTGDKMREDKTTIDDAAMADKTDDDAMMENEGEDSPVADKDKDTMMEKELAGTFAGAGDRIHNAEGVAKVISLEDGSDVLRLEDESYKRPGSVRLSFYEQSGIRLCRPW